MTQPQTQTQTQIQTQTQTKSELEPDDVLITLLSADAVPMPLMHERYGALLNLVRVLIGVVPNCDPYLEIWPPAFRTYNIIVPNFLNLPFGIFGIGGAPKAVVGLGTYVASRSAECAYCSAHTCSFALRRGASPEKMAKALVGGDDFTEQELATIAVARSLARVPCELTAHEKDALLACFNPSEAEWIVLGIVMMGFLNKFMDVLGVDLEASTVAETRTTLGANWNPGKAGRRLDITGHPTTPPPADTLMTKLSVLRYAPTALRLDKQWQQGVPSSWPAVGGFLHKQTGHDFPVLSCMQNARGIKAIASALRENLDPHTSVLGLNLKAMAGVVFATVVADAQLILDVRVLGLANGVDAAHMDAVAQYALNPDNEPPTSEVTRHAVLQLARAASSSPADITNSVLAECRDSTLSSAAIIELITWLSVLQMLHRLTCFYSTELSAYRTNNQ